MTVMKTNPRINLSTAELNELHDFILQNKKDGLSDGMDKIFKKIRLILYKIDMDMPVSGYRVQAVKKPPKYSAEGLGFGETAEQLALENVPNKLVGTAREDFNAQFSKMYLQASEHSEQPADEGESNNE